MRKINKIANIILIFMLLESAVCSKTGYALRPPSHFSKATEEFISQQSIQAVNLPNKPNIIDKGKKKISLREGGIVAAYKSYSMNSEKDSITTCCLCIIKNIRTGHYVAAHIMGQVFTYQKLDYRYLFAKNAIPKMRSFLKALDSNMNKKDLVAIIIGGGDQSETMQELALENFNDLKGVLGKEGIPIIGEEPVSEYKKVFYFSGSGKVYITHLGKFRFSIQDSIKPILSAFRRDKGVKSIKTDVDTKEEIYAVSVTKETHLTFPKEGALASNLSVNLQEFSRKEVDISL